MQGLHIARSGGGRPQVWFLVSVLIGALLIGPTTALASSEEGPSIEQRYDALVATVKEKKQDEAALKTAIEQATKLYGDAENSDKIRKALVTLVGGLTKVKKNDVLTVAAIDALIEMGAPAGAKYIKPFLRQRDTKKAPPLLQVGVAAAGELPHASLAEPLLKIVEKSKTSGIAAKAVQSLGKYHDFKRKRVKIFERLIKTVLKNKPGGPPRMRGSSQEDVTGGGSADPGMMGRDGGPTARWSALTRVLPFALSELTGMDVASVEDWFILAKENKGKIRQLFVDE